MRARLIRALFLGMGLLCLTLALVGVFLPLLPTTPFLLLSAACLARSSEPLHRWLLHHPRLGPFIQDWEREGAIQPSAKRTATGLILITGSLALALAGAPPWAKGAMVAVFAGVLTFIWTRPDGTSSH